MFDVVLVAPKIPPNTGNIIRLCANTGCSLHLLEPLGFEMDDTRLRRAGLDYREGVNITVYSTFDDLLGAHSGHRAWLFSTRYRKLYTDVSYQPGDLLVFGSETTGLPEAIHDSFNAESKLTLPMRPGNRSINLSNAVAIVVYEAWRQQGFILGNS